MDRGAFWAVVHEVAKNQTPLSNCMHACVHRNTHTHTHTHTLHSSMRRTFLFPFQKKEWSKDKKPSSLKYLVLQSELKIQKWHWLELPSQAIVLLAYPKKITEWIAGCFEHSGTCAWRLLFRFKSRLPRICKIWNIIPNCMALDNLLHLNLSFPHW